MTITVTRGSFSGGDDEAWEHWQLDFGQSSGSKHGLKGYRLYPSRAVAITGDDQFSIDYSGSAFFARDDRWVGIGLNVPEIGVIGEIDPPVAIFSAFLGIRHVGFGPGNVPIQRQYFLSVSNYIAHQNTAGYYTDYLNPIPSDDAEFLRANWLGYRPSHFAAPFKFICDPSWWPSYFVKSANPIAGGYSHRGDKTSISGYLPGNGYSYRVGNFGYASDVCFPDSSQPLLIPNKIPQTHVAPTLWEVNGRFSVPPDGYITCAVFRFYNIHNVLLDTLHVDVTLPNNEYLPYPPYTLSGTWGASTFSMPTPPPKSWIFYHSVAWRWPVLPGVYFNENQIGAYAFPSGVLVDGISSTRFDNSNGNLSNLIDRFSPVTPFPVALVNHNDIP
jgi:hypothetical protein